MLVFLVFLTIAHGSSPAFADTLRVPTGYPTIQTAIQAASPDDTILVSPGLYDENLDTLGKRLILIGEAGAEATIVDGGLRARVLTMTDGGIVEGFTLRRGYAASAGGGLFIDGRAGDAVRNNIIENNNVGGFDDGNGGGIYVDYGVTYGGLVIENNRIRNNYAGDSGGGIYDDGLYNELRKNVISGNGCHVGGGGAWLGGSRFVENLVINNWSDSFAGGVLGGGIEILNNTIVSNFTNNFPMVAGLRIYQGTPLVARNLVAENHGSGIQCATEFPGGHVRLECNDSWGNDGGDYVIASSCDTTGGRNFSANPLFCGSPLGDFRISELSPCSPSSPLNSGCGLIGAFPVGCGVMSLESTTWGRIKASYRDATR